LFFVSVTILHNITAAVFPIGRSNAINISEKLGLPSVVVSNARELHGAASAEINEVAWTYPVQGLFLVIL
jgi:hypothetical protein